MILTRPTYLQAHNYPEWVARNESLLAGYYLDCGKAIEETGGPGPTPDEWENFCASQWHLWLVQRMEEVRLANAGQRALDYEKDLSFPETRDEKRERLGR
jgi:hypothetical protein